MANGLSGTACGAHRTGPVEVRSERGGHAGHEGAWPFVLQGGHRRRGPPHPMRFRRQCCTGQPCPGFSYPLRGGGAQPQTLEGEEGGGVPGGGGGWHKASVSDCLPLAAPIGLSSLLILTLCVSERVLVVSTEPPDDLSCLTTPGVGRPGDGDVARAVDQGHPDAHSESTRGFAHSSTDLSALGCASAGYFS